MGLNLTAKIKDLQCMNGKTTDQLHVILSMYTNKGGINCMQLLDGIEGISIFLTELALMHSLTD